MFPAGLMPLIGTTETDYDAREEMARRKRDGSLMRDKARMILEELFFPQAIYALEDPEVSHQTKLDYVKQLVPIADVVPRQNTAPSGAGFTVNIVLPEPSTLTPSQPSLLNVSPGSPVPVFEPPVFAEPVPVEVQGSQGFRVPDFAGMGLPMTKDLAGPPVPVPPKDTP